jgi:LuxR family maltose regulon positive regulatory protein
MMLPRERSSRIDMLMLEVLLHQTQGEEDLALTRLKEAIALAEPENITAPFLDLQDRVTHLLRRLATGNPHEAFIRRIVDAGDGAENAAQPQGSSIPAATVPRLTHREQEILVLLRTRHHNKEIAEELQISTETVKTHLKGIFKKLGVHGRDEAAEKAVALGILTRR